MLPVLRAQRKQSQRMIALDLRKPVPNSDGLGWESEICEKRSIRKIRST